MKRDFKNTLQVCETSPFIRSYHLRLRSQRKPEYYYEDGQVVGQTLCGLDAVRDTSVSIVDYDNEFQYKQTYCSKCVEKAVGSTGLGIKDLRKSK